MFSSITVAQPNLLALNRYVIGSGIGMEVDSVGAIYLQGTFGQPITGQSEREAIVLSSGYWARSGSGYSLYIPIILR